MLLYFNKNGQLLEQLEYGPVARVGTTNYKIIAVFEDLDVSTVQSVYVKLYKPDLNHSTFNFDLEMSREDFYFNGESNYFKRNVRYDAYVLDFNDIFGEDFDESLIDMAGVWKSVIIIRGNNYNVQGVAPMNVQSGIGG